jgi:hypothetical protein
LADEQVREAKDREDQMLQNLAVFEQARRVYKSSSEDLNTRLNASLCTLGESETNLQKELAERRRLAEILAETNGRLDQQIQKGEILRSQLEAAERQTSEIQSRLRKEAEERQHLAQALEASQRALRDQSRGSELAISRLESALRLEEVERKRLEMHALQLSRATRDSARKGRVARIAVRRQIQQPVDEMCQSARHLIQSELDDEQKRLVQNVLENSLLIKANLVDAAPSERVAGGPND